MATATPRCPLLIRVRRHGPDGWRDDLALTCGVAGELLTKVVKFLTMVSTRHENGGRQADFAESSAAFKPVVRRAVEPDEARWARRSRTADAPGAPAPIVGSSCLDSLAPVPVEDDRVGDFASPRDLEVVVAVAAGNTPRDPQHERAVFSVP